MRYTSHIYLYKIYILHCHEMAPGPLLILVTKEEPLHKYLRTILFRREWGMRVRQYTCQSECRRARVDLSDPQPGRQFTTSRYVEQGGAHAYETNLVST